MNVLLSTDTEGVEFELEGGKYQLVVADTADSSDTELTAAVTMQIKLPGFSPAYWIDTDVTFSADGVKAFEASPASVYRVVTDTAGAVAHIETIEKINNPFRV